MAKNSNIKIIIPEDKDGIRLDKILSTLQDNISRMRVQSLIRDGQAQISRNGTDLNIKDISWRVKPNDKITLIIPEAKPFDLKPQPIPLDILYEDDHLIVINKVSGMVVHPAPGNEEGTLANALMAHCQESLSGIGDKKRPGIVHRLDKDTSGIIVSSKTDIAHLSLSEQFASHGKDGRIMRSYQALVWGKPIPPIGRIEGALARHHYHRKKMAISQKKNARFAATQYKCLKNWGKPPIISLVECLLETGRTHQIRVHMTHIGYPIVSDKLYGSSQMTRCQKLPNDIAQKIKTLNRQALHANLLGFEHPHTKKKMRFETKLPDDIQHIIQMLDHASMC